MLWRVKNYANRRNALRSHERSLHVARIVAALRPHAALVASHERPAREERTPYGLYAKALRSDRERVAQRGIAGNNRTVFLGTGASDDDRPGVKVRAQAAGKSTNDQWF